MSSRLRRRRTSGQIAEGYGLKRLLEVVSMKPTFVPLSYDKPCQDEVAKRARSFFEQMHRRRSVRAFSDEPVSDGIIRDLVRAASTAPSAAPAPTIV